METTLVIRHKHLYKIWFVDLIRQMIADPDRIDKTLSEIGQQEDRYLKTLFAVGGIKPRSTATTDSKIFKAHLEGLKVVGSQVKKFTKKYPKLQSVELADARWIRTVVDWAGVLAGQAAASCNSQAEDDGGPFNDPNKCVDAWLAYNDAVIAHGMAQANLDDCLFQNSNPPQDQTPDDNGPFGGIPALDPCLTQAMTVVLAENNMNAAWNDISVWC